VVTLWIGDFRIQQIKKMSKAIQQATNYYFLIDDSADSVWLKDSVINQVKKLYLENANMIIALGFMDCVYSCIWNSFDIDTSIEQYTSIIQVLKDTYPKFNFYFCSVNPIDTDYYFAGNKIKKAALLDKIKYFNKRIKEKINISFIDSYNYLMDVKFTTRDGVYFTSSTCNVLHSYIKNLIGYNFDLNKDDLCLANSYNISIEDMQPNARYIYKYLRNEGWTLKAIAGLLGNVQVESKMSPWMWQGTIDGSIINDDETHTLNMSVLADSAPGYGLFQWTPYSKYIDWCTDNNLDYWDIDSQLLRICWEVKNNEQWIVNSDNGYNITFKEFIISDKDPYWLAGAFAFCYERPGSSTGTAEQQSNLKIERGNNANYWYEYLSNFNFDESASASTVIKPIQRPKLEIEDIFTDINKLNKSISLYLNK
jgi:hypothetical protein